MKTKRLTLESFKSVVKRIIKEEMYRNQEEKKFLEDNDFKKSRELEENTILNVKVNINRIDKSLQIILPPQKQDFIFNYHEQRGYSFSKSNYKNVLTKEGALKFIKIITEALDYMQVDKSTIYSKQIMIIGFLSTSIVGQEKVTF